MLCTLSVVGSMLLASSHVLGALDPGEMQQRLMAGAPILGTFNDTGSDLVKWMGSLPDDISIEMINIPGTHDSCAWNYTGPSPESFNTQSLPVFDQLNAGIRFLDIRFGVNNGQIMVYHGDALLSDTVQLEDVLWGLYHFLDVHPTETIVASLKVDHGDANDPTMQQTLHDHFTTAPTSDYWVQSDTPGTLGPARHKVILFRRYGLLPGLAPIGIDVSHDWRDNDGDFVISYSPASQRSAFIEDLYEIDGDNVPPSAKIPIKFNAVTSHIENANADANKTQLFVSFASVFGGGIGNTLTPKVLALGDEANNVTGINKRMLPWLQQRRGNRFGVVLFDFFDSEPGLVEAAIGQSATNSSSTSSASSGQPSRTASPNQASLAIAPSAVPASLPYLIALFIISMLASLLSF